MVDASELRSAFLRYVLSLLIALGVTGLVLVTFGGDAEPGTPAALVGVVVFFSTFTLLLFGDKFVEYARETQSETGANELEDERG